MTKTEGMNALPQAILSYLGWCVVWISLSFLSTPYHCFQPIFQRVLCIYLWFCWFYLHVRIMMWFRFLQNDTVAKEIDHLLHRMQTIIFIIMEFSLVLVLDWWVKTLQSFGISFTYASLFSPYDWTVAIKKVKSRFLYKYFPVITYCNS